MVFPFDDPNLYRYLGLHPLVTTWDSVKGPEVPQPTNFPNGKYVDSDIELGEVEGTLGTSRWVRCEKRFSDLWEGSGRLEVPYRCPYPPTTFDDTRFLVNGGTGVGC